MVPNPKTHLMSAGQNGFSRTAEWRDTRLDVLRALALLAIFINHVPGQIFENLTTKNFGFSDSAEAFVLISGTSVGLAYGGRFAPGDRLASSLKAMRRAFTLYMAHMITTFMTLALFISGAWLFHRPGLLCEINILAVLTNLKEGIPALLLLGHQIGYNNILPMYGALLLMVPLMLLLEAYSPLLLLAVSGGVWFVAGVYRIAPHNMLLDGYWFLNPLSWQFLFAIGVVGMMHVRRGGSLPRHPALLALSVMYIIISFVWVMFKLWSIGNIMASSGLPLVLVGFDKTFLSLPRLLHVLALAYLVVNIPVISGWLRRSSDNPLTILGRHSLNIFAAGTILAMIGQVILYITNNDHVVGPLYVVLGILIQFAYASHLERKRLLGRQAVNAPANAVAVRTGGRRRLNGERG
jgi:hypothetical protein